ncbi:MAG: hypothetical protein K9W44_02250 [Candidatus Lokiarchaeota archaeon]|nr:hypothetical protein [Candidatus Harpocratesius repetitus]
MSEQPRISLNNKSKISKMFKDDSNSGNSLINKPFFDRLSKLEKEFYRLNQEQLITELDHLLHDCINNEEYLAALMNCKALISLQSQFKNSKVDNKYSILLQQLQKTQQRINKQKWAEIKKVNQIILELEKKINIDEDIAPYMTTIPLEELEIDGLQLENIIIDSDKLFETHRVMQSREISRSGVIQLQSGKTFPLHNQSNIILNKITEKDSYNSMKAEYTAEFSLNFKATDDDPIENAFIQDIIPYNFEVLEVEINGESKKSSPNRFSKVFLKIVSNIAPKIVSKIKAKISYKKVLRQQGLEFTFHLKDIPPNTPINFKYFLRPRISRTILVPTNSDLKVIHTHSNLQEENPIQGTYRTFLEFKNEFAQELDNVLMEDIIPEFYSYEVQEKKKGNFLSKKELSPFLVKWRLYDMGLKYVSEDEYKLTEYETIERQRREAEKILAISPDKVPRKEREELLYLQQAAKRFLSQTNIARKSNFI